MAIDRMPNHINEFGSYVQSELCKKNPAKGLSFLYDGFLAIIEIFVFQHIGNIHCDSIGKRHLKFRKNIFPMFILIEFIRFSSDGIQCIACYDHYDEYFQAQRFSKTFLLFCVNSSRFYGTIEMNSLI